MCEGIKEKEVRKRRRERELKMKGAIMESLLFSSGLFHIVCVCVGGGVEDQIKDKAFCLLSC